MLCTMEIGWMIVLTFAELLRRGGMNGEWRLEVSWGWTWDWDWVWDHVEIKGDGEVNEPTTWKEGNLSLTYIMKYHDQYRANMLIFMPV